MATFAPSRTMRIVTICLMFVLAVGLTSLRDFGAAQADSPSMSAASGGVPSVPLAFNWSVTWDRVVEFLRQSVGTKRRLIQILTIGVCIGLFIMFRSRK